MADIELLIKIPEKVRVAITRVGLLRIPEEMQKEVDEAIQRGKPLPDGNQPEQESKWIPVSEPPKESGEYFVTLKIQKDIVVDKLSYSRDLYSVDKFDFADKKRAGWYDLDTEYGYYEVDNVIAWMPLPKPYRG